MWRVLETGFNLVSALFPPLSGREGCSRPIHQKRSTEAENATFLNLDLLNGTNQRDRVNPSRGFKEGDEVSCGPPR